MINNVGINITGHVKIWDPNTQEVFVDKYNAINPETMSIVIAKMLTDHSALNVTEMHFGSGGTIIDNESITYRDVVVNLESGVLAGLFSPAYYKVVDIADTENNLNPESNSVNFEHLDGLTYSDIIITCTLADDEPHTLNGVLTFDEIGLKSKGYDGLNSGYFLSHIVFEPVRKTFGRVVQVVYTLRISIS